MATGDEPIGWLILKRALLLIGAMVLISLLIWAVKWGLILAVVGAIAYGLFRLVKGALGEDRRDDEMMLTQQPEGGLVDEADDILLDFEAAEEQDVDADPLSQEIERAARHSKRSP